MVRNSDLHEAVKGLFSEFLLLLRKAPRDVEAIRRHTTYYAGGVAHAANQFDLIQEIRRILEQHFSSIRSWPEYQSLRTLLQRGFPYQPANPIPDGMGLLDLSYLPSLIRMLLTANAFKLDFDEQSFERAYQMIENGLYSDTIEFGVRAPLHGVAPESDEVRFSDDLVLRQIEKDDFENLVLSLDVRSFIRSPDSPALSSVAIMTQRRSRKGQAAPSIDPWILARRLAAILSVFLKHRVEAGEITAVPKDHWMFMAGTASRRVPDEHPFMFDLATLKTEDEPDLRQLWCSYQKAVSANPWLDFALERLYRSFFTLVANERIVDLTTILEILYSHDSTTELKYKLSIRTAFCLEQEKQRRIDLYKLMALMYDVRSSIVHSGMISKTCQKKIDSDYKGTEAFVAEVEKIVFASLEFFIRNPAVREDIEHIVFA